MIPNRITFGLHKSLCTPFSESSIQPRRLQGLESAKIPFPPFAVARSPEERSSERSRRRQEGGGRGGGGEEEAHQDQLQRMAVGGVGEGLRGVALPRRVHEGRPWPPGWTWSNPGCR
ncbi:hypothetical protein CEXT_30431 [Caerostris extrusa]|uniref:Uncharacterized protein n=1 Tax=Caerostris extrusa TaxID=172846 RepID=A0AAV4QP87_CAEEX|nr:hypothetical protein CEXT_30431 [Caerostris extrusa]